MSKIPKFQIRYNDVNCHMTEAEKKLYGSKVAADIDRILEVVDEDLHSLSLQQ